MLFDWSCLFDHLLAATEPFLEHSRHPVIPRSTCWKEVRSQHCCRVLMACRENFLLKGKRITSPYLQDAGQNLRFLLTVQDLVQGASGSAMLFYIQICTSIVETDSFPFKVDHETECCHISQGFLADSSLHYVFLWLCSSQRKSFPR